jgi:hypothetical protein
MPVVIHLHPCTTGLLETHSFPLCTTALFICKMKRRIAEFFIKINETDKLLARLFK